jgi:heat shock protein HslJ
MKTTFHSSIAPLILLITLVPSLVAADDLDWTKKEKWVLKSWTAGQNLPENIDHRPYLTFKKDKFHGTAGINLVSGSAKAKNDGSLAISLGGMTEIGGPPEIMKMESTFTKLLGGVTRWKVDGETLILSDGTPKLELRFETPAAKKNLPLIDTRWTLIGTEENTGETSSMTALLPGTSVTLSLQIDGRVAGSAGVNRYQGKAETKEGQKIKFGPMMSTRRGGPEKHMKQEADFLKHLGKVSRWTVTGERLELADEKRSFVLIFEGS